ncbi:HupE/UreJ family protein [Scandinavium sp. V105_16]|uniref:HupE/UreJ family protein n=1 Tax=Scandinavium lactucae TaxID=3095028 RepID=A0AAJ2RYJ6_9ENTR|nr:MULTISPECIES: HupE/UreJ family protein [unclassified Scandinavium]MDX6021105.1 HupE/UreJ family protein [Scandinavium sp. V105_16]MDX6031096.1 HupE/UreJ family protein [Scandinavium sp. V105_12]MDX6041614.1 HupE/UreJ family protein [Scandinavium sp. V105_6]MDX6049535.1 HupE/UreJ family protein [Scandinavium sp. V105_1]
MNGLIAVMLSLILLPQSAWAHAGNSAGWWHPLSGVDHLLAMIAVGAWSVQLGGRAIGLVPLAFVCFMFFGGLLGFEHVELPATEVGVSLSVLLLGLAIAAKQRLPLALAACATGLFGICHGYAHGYEMPVLQNKTLYTVGFMSTTAALHIVGALGAHTLQKMAVGDRVLRLLGAVSALCGIWLVAGAI